MYKVILMLEEEIDNIHNPTFLFSDFNDADMFFDTLIFQGYGVFMIKDEKE